MCNVEENSRGDVNADFDISDSETGSLVLVPLYIKL